MVKKRKESKRKNNGFVIKIKIFEYGKRKFYGVFFGPTEKEMIPYGSYEIKKEAEEIAEELGKRDNELINKVYNDSK